jgi:DHA1 family multidrug resistance protein-like MFS transporter
MHTNINYEYKGMDVQISPRTLLFMGLFIFLMSIGEGMTAPAIPLYGDALGASYRQLGFLMTGYSIAYTVMTVIAGRLSDKLGRKRILLGSIILSIVASTGYYLSTVPPSLLIFRTVEGMSRGVLWPVAEAIVADNTTYEGREKAMGRFSAAYGAGVTIGTLTGGYIMEYVSLTTVFPVYSILGIAAFTISLLGVTEVNNNRHMSASGFTVATNALREIKKIWPVCYVGFAYSGFLYSLWGLLSKVADTCGVSPKGIGVIFTLFWGVRLASFMFCGEAAENLGQKKVLIVGVCFCALAAGIFLLANNFRLLAFAAIASGIGTGIMFPLSITMVADYASPAYLGFVMGFMEFIMGIGMIIQTALAGILGDLGGAHLTYLFTFIVTAIAIPISLVFIREVGKSNS